MRRCICLVLLLGHMAWGSPLETVDTAFLQAAAQASEFGNFLAASRVTGELLKALKPLKGAAYERERASLQADQVLLLEKAQHYSDALRLGQELLASRNLDESGSERAMVGTALVARAIQRVDLLDPLLPRLELGKQPMSRFVARVLTLERELERHPDTSQESILAAVRKAWEPLLDYRPGAPTRALQLDGACWLEAERVLLGIAQSLPDKQAWSDELGRIQGLVSASIDANRNDYLLGFVQLNLDGAEFDLSVGDVQSAGNLLGQIDTGALTPLRTMVAEAEAARPTPAASLAKDCALLGVNPAVLRFSLADGSLAALLWQHSKLRARLAMDSGQGDALPLLTEAEKLQAKVGFEGLEDVRWDLLRYWLSHPEGEGLARARTTVDGLLADCLREDYLVGQIIALGYQGRLFWLAGQKSEALTDLSNSVGLLERYLTESGAGTAGKAQLKQLFKVIYDDQARYQLESGQTQQAYETLARRQQMETLGQAPRLSTVPAPSSAMEQEVARKKAAGQDASGAEAMLLRSRGDYRSALIRLRQENPRYDSQLAIHPVSFATQQKFIPQNTAIVQYFPAGSSLYIFVATRESLQIAQVKIGDLALNEMIRDFRKATLSRQSTPANAQALSRVLLDPIKADLAAKPVLAFVPTGMLNYVPFGALSPDGKDYLVASKQCVTLMKSSDLDELTHAPARSQGELVALGNPDGTLPAAASEATEVARVFDTQALIGAEATLSRITGLDPKKVSYLHLATHGRLNARDPVSSQLVLAGRNLGLNQVYDLKLDGLRLVTLSACQTALGDANPGMELTTLADAFSLAGANSVVASLWSVDDQSTRDLMVEFYARLKQGASLAEALQAAQQKLSGRPPFYWAAFELIGDWR